MQRAAFAVVFCIARAANLRAMDLLVAPSEDIIVGRLPAATLHEVDFPRVMVSDKKPLRSVALLLVNTKEGLGSALGTFKNALDMAARSGAVLIDPLVSQGYIGTLGCATRKSSSGKVYRSGTGGARLSDYFDYIGPQCPLVIDYDLHAMDVVMYPVADRALRDAWSSDSAVRSTDSVAADAAWHAFLKDRGWLFCDVDEHPHLKVFQDCGDGRACSCTRDAVPPRVQARRSVCVATSIYQDCDAKKLWQSIQTGVEARDRRADEHPAAASEHYEGGETPFTIVIAGSVVQYDWNFRGLFGKGSDPVDESYDLAIARNVNACMPQPYKVSNVVDAMARAFADTHLGGGDVVASTQLLLRSSAREAYWASRRYASVQLRLHHMIHAMYQYGIQAWTWKAGEAFTSLDDDFSAPSTKGLAHPIEWTVNAVNRALLVGVARKRDAAFSAFAPTARLEGNTAAGASLPKLPVYVASDIWSDHDGDSEWRLKDQSATRRSVLDLLRDNLIRELSADHLRPIRLEPETMLAPLCEHAAVATDATRRAQCVALVADDSAGAALLLDLTLVRRGRVTVIAGGGAFSNLLSARKDRNAATCAKRRRLSTRSTFPDWCVVDDEASNRLEYRIACHHGDGFQVSCSNG